MKKRALGSFCLQQYLLYLFLWSGCLYIFFYEFLSIENFIIVVISNFIYFVAFVYFVFEGVQVIYKLCKCYYILFEDSCIISMLVGKKRKKWYDTFSVLPKGGIHAKTTYQLTTFEIKYGDIIKLVCLGEINKSVGGLTVSDICVVLKDGKKAYLSRRQFSKKQVLEVINTIREKNKDVELGERLKRELKLT